MGDLGAVKVPVLPVLFWSAFVYLAVIVVGASTATVANDASNPFIYVFRLLTFTLITGMPVLFSAILFITTTLPLLYLLFMPLVESASVITAGAASNSLGGQVVIVAAVVGFIGVVIGLLFAFLA